MPEGVFFCQSMRVCWGQVLAHNQLSEKWVIGWELFRKAEHTMLSSHPMIFVFFALNLFTYVQSDSFESFFMLKNGKMNIP